MHGKLVLLSSSLLLAAVGSALFLIKDRGSAKRKYDKLRSFVLKNAKGVEVHITPVGAAIQRLLVPDKHRQVADVVLGFDRASTYATCKPSPYFGAIVGRCANRIQDAKFKINEQEYHLTANNGNNALHGGELGLHKRVWDAAEEADERGDCVVLTYSSPDGEEGYPGHLYIMVRYLLMRNSNELRTTITATTDKPTPVNLVQHSYFNLAGHDRGNILEHVLRIAGDHYTPTDARQLPTGETLPVAGTPFDFTNAQPVGARLAEVVGGYDHNYVLFGMGPQARFIVKHGMASSTPRLAATLTDPSSGRRLEVLTTAPGVQLYSGNFLDELGGKGGKDGAVYGKHAGLCLETQAFPNAINQPRFPSVVLSPGEAYKHEIVYRFSNAGTSTGGSTGSSTLAGS